MKVASFRFNPDRLASASPWHPRDKTVCIKNHDYFFSSPLLEAQQTPGLDCQQRWTCRAQLVQLDVWIPVGAFRAPVGIAANDGVDVLETPVDLHLSLDPVVLGARDANKAANHFLYQVIVWMMTNPSCSNNMFQKKVVVQVGCRSPNMYSWWMRHFLTKASRSIRQF